VSKSRIRWARHERRIERRVLYGVVVGKLDCKNHSENPGVYGMIILR
jgi:hypothetical protein